MSIEELFGTLQQSVIVSWRKHLKTDKHSKHVILNDFYEDMPELVDKLIEDWMGINGKVDEYINIFDGTSKMSTIEYLEKLKDLVDDGRDLVEEYPEVEADLDDIASLIDSTLYKLKELTENKNKIMNLKDFINESLLNEASDEFVMVWNHWSPEDMHIVFGDIKKLDKISDEYDYCVEYMGIKPSDRLVGIAWNDETGYCWDVPGNNINDAKKKELDYIQKQLNNMKEYIEKDRYVYLESNIFGSAGEWMDEDVIKMTAKDFLNHFISMVEGSRVDGDSGYGRSVIDIKRKNVVLGRDVEFISVDDFLSRFENN